MTLASAVQKARDFSVPMDNIERAIKRAAGEGGGARFEEVTYEGYGPAGVAVLVHAMTDNRNRTSQEVRHAFTRLGGSLADPGSVAWQFDRRGIVAVDKSVAPDEERLLEIVVEAGADDLRDAEDRWEVITAPEAMQEVRGALEGAGVQVATADVAMVPQNSVPVGADKAGSVLRLIDELEDLDDVQEVYSNFDIPDEVLAQVG
jgi:YebC/PmpR family DNA-binding regulatory protein